MEYHKPVLLNESIDLLSINPDGTYVDATFGGGGHSNLILEKLSLRKIKIKHINIIDELLSKF